jgi:Flp pilus assembly protein TadD
MGCSTIQQMTDPLLGSIGRDAKHDDGLARLAADLEGRGQVNAALPLYERAAAMSGGTLSANVRLGDAYMRAGKANRAAVAYRAALAKAPENDEALLGLGFALLKTGDPDGAIAALAQTAPRVNTMQAYNRLAVAQTLAGRFKEAEQSFRSASALAPDDLDIRTNLALTLALDGQENNAIVIMREVVASPSCETRHHRNLVIVFGLYGRVDEGRASMPADMQAAEVDRLLARAGAIRAMPNARARAKALGMIAMS